MKTMRAIAAEAVLTILPLAVVATALSGLVYVVAQQDLRSGADEVPLQRAMDAAAALNAGTPPATVVSSGEWIGSATVDVAQSLAPFLVVFDSGTHVLATNAQLGGAIPVPPAGVLAAATADTPNRVTWQPQPSMRIATVTARWNGGTVLVGRSLREVERRVGQMTLLVGLGWTATIVVLTAAAVVRVVLAARMRLGTA